MLDWPTVAAAFAFGQVLQSFAWTDESGIKQRDAANRILKGEVIFIYISPSFIYQFRCTTVKSYFAGTQEMYLFTKTRSNYLLS